MAVVTYGGVPPGLAMATALGSWRHRLPDRAPAFEVVQQSAADLCARGLQARWQPMPPTGGHEQVVQEIVRRHDAWT